MTRTFEKSRPFVGQIHFLHNGLDGSFAHFDGRWQHFLHWRRRGSRCDFFVSRLRGNFGYGGIHRLGFSNFGWCRGFCGRSGAHQFFVRQSSGALEAAAQFTEAFRTARVAGLAVNLFQLRGEFGSAAVVAGAKNEVEQFFECRSVARCAAQDGFEQSNGFLREAVAGEQVHVGERLRDKFLCFFVESGLIRNDGRLGLRFRSGFWCIGAQLGSCELPEAPPPAWSPRESLLRLLPDREGPFCGARD